MHTYMYIHIMVFPTPCSHVCIGAYSNNPNRAGQCYRLAVKGSTTTNRYKFTHTYIHTYIHTFIQSFVGVDRDVIVQVVDQGPPVADGNFQILLGAGIHAYIHIHTFIHLSQILILINRRVRF